MHRSVTVHGLCAPQNGVHLVASHARAHFSPPQTIPQVTFCTRSFLLACSCTKDSPKINYIKIGRRAKQRCPSTYQKQTGNSSSGSAQESRLNSSHLQGSEQLHTSLHQSSFPTTSKSVSSYSILFILVSQLAHQLPCVHHVPISIAWSHAFPILRLSYNELNYPSPFQPNPSLKTPLKW